MDTDPLDPLDSLGPGWTVTEPPRRGSRSRRPSKSASLLQQAAAANLKAQRAPSDPGAVPRSQDTSDSQTPEDGGYSAFKARFLKEYRQQERVESMAICRRQRKVFETLQANHEVWEPRLARAARAEAEDFFRRMRTASDQQASCALLARRRPSSPGYKEAEAEELVAPARSWAEQQARASELAEPRAARREEETSRPEPLRRSAAEQQRHMAVLARPKMPKTEWMEEMESTEGRSLWKEELMARAAALVPEEVQAARFILEKMRSRPRSAKHREAPAASAGAAAPTAEVEQVEQAEQLKSAVEEVLWVALLQVRSCPKPGGAALEERLGSLLISKIGPALRPVARRLLAPGHSLPRRLRAEFPRLARHLCFRDSEDFELPPTSWKNEDLVARLNQVREVRDDLLGMDFTKDAVARLVEAAG